MSIGRNQNTQPNWAGDFLGRDQLLPGGARLDSSQFVAYPGPVTVTLTAGAAVGAVSLTVAALSAIVPAGTVLTFGVPGKYAVVALNAAAAAVAITVLPIDQALVTGDAAVFPGSIRKIVPSGTVLGRTYAERNAGTGFGPAAAGDDEVFILAGDVVDAAVNDDVNLVRAYAGVIVKENFLPNWQGLAAAVQAFVRLRYISTLGAE